MRLKEILAGGSRVLLYGMMKDSVRNGLDAIYVSTGGIRLDAAFRSPKRNAVIGGKKLSAHICGMGADMKPVGAPGGPMDESDWNALAAIVSDRNIGKAVYTEPFLDGPSHVHGSFEWWPGRRDHFRAQP